MTRRQHLFIKEYILSQNATESAKKAGYSQKTAYSIGQRLLKSVEVQRALEEEYKRVAEEYKFEERDVFKGLGEIARNGQQESNRVRSWELIGKALNMFKDNNVNISVVQSLDQDKLTKLRKSLRDKRLRKGGQSS